MCVHTHAPLCPPSPHFPKAVRPTEGERLGLAPLTPASRRDARVQVQGWHRDPEIPTEANDVDTSIKLSDDEPYLTLEIPTLNLRLKSCMTKIPTENPLTCL